MDVTEIGNPSLLHKLVATSVLNLSLNSLQGVVIVRGSGLCLLLDSV